MIVAVKHGIPWIYGGCVGMGGRVMAIQPGKTACLRCIFPQPPKADDLPTCDTAGVLGPAAGVVGAHSGGAGDSTMLVEGEGDTSPGLMTR